MPRRATHDFAGSASRSAGGVLSGLPAMSAPRRDRHALAPPGRTIGRNQSARPAAVAFPRRRGRRRLSERPEPRRREGNRRRVCRSDAGYARGRRGEGETGEEDIALPVSPSPPLPSSPILLAGDARPLTAELVAAAAEGLRSTGCNVVDIGPSTAPCLAFAVHHLQAAGGVLVGNPGEDSHTAGLKFWAAGPRPLSAGGSRDCPNFRISENGTVPFDVAAALARIGRPAIKPAPARPQTRPTPPLPSRSALLGPNGGTLLCVAAVAGCGRFGIAADARFPATAGGDGRLPDHSKPKHAGRPAAADSRRCRPLRRLHRRRRRGVPRVGRARPPGSARAAVAAAGPCIRSLRDVPSWP